MPFLYKIILCFTSRLVKINMPRTKQQFEDIRQKSCKKFLDATLEVFSKQGYHLATVDAFTLI